MKYYQQKARLLLAWFIKEKEPVFKIYVLALLQGIIYISVPLGIQGIITYIMAGKFSASLILLCIVTILATLFIGILQLWQMRINETLHEKIFSNIIDRLALFLNEKNAIRHKIEYFFEAVTLQKGIGKILLDFSFSIISILFGLLILPAYSSWFFVFSIVLSVIFCFIVVYYGNKSLEGNIKTSNEKYNVFGSLQKLNLDMEVDSLSQIDTSLQEYLTARQEYYQTFESQYKAILVFKIVFVGILLFLGTYLVQIGELNIGQFVSSEIIILLVINSVEKLIISIETCYDAITALYKIESLFDTAGEHSYLNSAGPSFLHSMDRIYQHPYKKKIWRIIYSIMIAGAILLFMPWTQTVNMDGQVSVLDPTHKPQQVNSRIAGRIEKWYIKDGNFVKKNDTIAFISEVKVDYMDTLLVERSESQVKSKETAMKSYEGKVNAIDEQIDALNKSLRLKTLQVENKIKQAKTKLNSDSVESLAAKGNFEIADEQLKRYQGLLEKGIISKTDFENRKVKLQDALAKKISASNKIINAKNDLLNAEIELNSIRQEFNEKLMKAESDKYSSLSLMYDAEGSLTKLQNQLASYSLRNSYYYVLAPQDGYINHIVVNGVGEIIKEGDMLCRIIPLQKEQVVELYVDPIDLPLISKGNSVQLVFDGWPSFFFSGWPGMSYGTFSAKVNSFDKVISENGKFRVLAINEGKPWPGAIQIGGGAKGVALLGNVPLIYELWRKLNGFPPEFYNKKYKKKDENKKGK